MIHICLWYKKSDWHSERHKIPLLATLGPDYHNVQQERRRTKSGTLHERFDHRQTDSPLPCGLTQTGAEWCELDRKSVFRVPKRSRQVRVGQVLRSNRPSNHAASVAIGTVERSNTRAVRPASWDSTAKARVWPIVVGGRREWSVEHLDHLWPKADSFVSLV